MKMVTIDKRRKYYVMLDTETCPLVKSGAVDPNNMFVYDIGFAVVDKHGNVYEQRSYVVGDIFFEEKELMKSGYYANKLPQYYDDIRSGSRVVKSFNGIRKELADIMELYNTNIVIAHNARFDDLSLKNTQRWLTKSKYRYFLPYGTVVWDTLAMAKSILLKRPTYRAFCERNGYITKGNQPQTKAEIIYRFISGNNDFIESHTGLEDVMIEKDIFHYLMRQHKPMRKELYARA